MKNFKKVLALVLVIASLMGLATMASATKSEDYSDAASISHVEAVDVMSTIGVFDGISGAFSGDSILTREQAAKIITYMILGKDDADALVASVAPYTDVARDRWSAGSIAYCKNAGILAGVGNGRFEPNGKLTGVAFAKMCLVALGYDPNVEGLTGSDWAVNTSKLAIAGAGISANLSQASLADEMTREDACQMAFNTVKADLVDYEDRGASVTVNGGDGKDITISSSPSKAKPVTIETNRVDEKNVVGNIKEETQRVGGSTNLYAGILQFGERYFPKLKQETGERDDFGRPTVRWTYKSEEIGNYVCTDQLIQTWTAKAPMGEMHSAIGGAIVDKLHITTDDEDLTWTDSAGKLRTEKEYTLLAYVDGQITTGAKDNYFKSKSTAAAGYAIEPTQNSFIKEAHNIGISGNGVQTELYMDDDGNVTIVMVNTYLVKATADYNTANERVNVEAMEIDSEKITGTTTSKVDKSFLPTTLSSDDFDVAGVKDGDYLLVRVSYKGKAPAPTANGGKAEKPDAKEVVPATLQTATVSEFTEHEDVTMGGTKYEYNKILGENENGETFAINSDASIVLDTYGYIMYVDEAVSVNNFVYIDKFGSSSTITRKAIADAYFSDGTNNEIQISRVDDVSSDAKICAYSDGELYAHWYTFSGGANGQYTLNTPNKNRYSDPYQATLTGNYLSDLGSSDNGVIIKNSAVKFMGKLAKGPDQSFKTIRSEKSSTTDVSADAKENAENLKANEKTIFVVKDSNGDVSSYTGIANAPTVKLKSIGSNNDYQKVKISWIKRDDYARFVFIDVSEVDALVDEVANAAEYMFTLKSTGNMTHVDGLTYYKYMVIIDGKEEERWISSGLVNGTPEDVGRLFYNVKEDSDNRITRGYQVGTNKKDRQFAANMYWKADPAHTHAADTISQNGNSLYINALEHAVETQRKDDLIATSGSNINLVVGKGVGSLLKDSGASYEVYQNVSAGFVGSFLGNHKLSGHVYVVVNENDEDVIDVLWIYVDGIDNSGNSKNDGNGNTTEKQGDYLISVGGPAASTGETLTVTVDGFMGLEFAQTPAGGATLFAQNPDDVVLYNAPAAAWRSNGTFDLKKGDYFYILQNTALSGTNYICAAAVANKLGIEYVDYKKVGTEITYKFVVPESAVGKTASIGAADANYTEQGGLLTSKAPDLQPKEVYSVTLDGYIWFYAATLSGDVELGVDNADVYAIAKDVTFVTEGTTNGLLVSDGNGKLAYSISGDTDFVTAVKVELTSSVSATITGQPVLAAGKTHYVKVGTDLIFKSTEDKADNKTVQLLINDETVTGYPPVALTTNNPQLGRPYSAEKSMTVSAKLASAK